MPESVSASLEALANYGGDFPEWEWQAALCRQRFANLIGCLPEEVAFVRNTSHALGLIAEGLEWKAGDRIAVATNLEYPSNVHVLVAELKQRKIVVTARKGRVRVSPHFYNTLRRSRV